MRLGIGKFVMALTALVFMAVLGGCGSLVQSGGDEGGNQGGNQESQGGQQAQTSEETGQQDGGGDQAAAGTPQDPTLSLSAPEAGIEIDSIPTGRGDDVQLLTDNAAVHVYPTAFPWQEGANTFLAGHVEGYEGTPSYKAFAGIKKLENGDEIVVTDANGTDYTYEVYNAEITAPGDVQVLDPVPGRSIVTLQTCEIVSINPDGTPDYSNTERYIVQGELVS